MRFFLKKLFLKLYLLIYYTETIYQFEILFCKCYGRQYYVNFI
jgi:hypothetical protein